MQKLDEKDRQILNLYLEKPGITQKQIAEKIGLTGPAVNNRIQRMKNAETIKGFTPIIDLKKLGYDITIIVDVKIKGGNTREAAQKWAKDPNVTALYVIA